MNILSRLFKGKATVSHRDGKAIAEVIIARYQHRRACGEFRVDDKLWLDLYQVLPKEAAQDIFVRFRQRRARSDAKAELKLGIEIGIAIADADHFAATAQPIMRPPSPLRQEEHGPASAAKTWAKAANGQSISDADENAVLFGDLVDDR